MSATTIDAEHQTLRAEFRKFVQDDLNDSCKMYLELEKHKGKYGHEMETQKQKQKRIKSPPSISTLCNPAHAKCSYFVPFRFQSSEKYPGGVRACRIPSVLKAPRRIRDLPCLHCKPICLSMSKCNTKHYSRTRGKHTPTVAVEMHCGILQGVFKQQKGKSLSR